MTDLTPPDPARFNMTSFVDLLPRRACIIGEDPGSFEGFHAGMMQSLLPMTPYEGVIAENLIAIEWELLQHRRMRDAGLRRAVSNHLSDAVVKREAAAHDARLDEAWEAHVAEGGMEEDWEVPFSFDRDAVQDAGQALAQNAVSRDPDTHQAACAEIEDMSLGVLALMSEAYLGYKTGVTRHEDKLPELERRRREVMLDFDALQKARPLEAETIAG